jgi:RecB family exonuclease
MPKKKLQRIEAWSFSRFGTYETCPARAKFKYLDKLDEPQGQAASRGSEIHKLAEKYVLGKLPPRIPEDLDRFEDEFENLRKLNKRRGVHVSTEQQWAFTRDWEVTGWFEVDTWCRMVVDAAVLQKDTLTIIDYKTGKIRPDHKKQLELFALGGLVLHPQVKQVRAELWYLDQGVLDDEHYGPKQVKKLQKTWADRTRRMLNDTRFDPNPSGACNWCAFAKKKGGPCRF